MNRVDNYRTQSFSTTSYSSILGSEFNGRAEIVQDKINQEVERVLNGLLDQFSTILSSTPSTVKTERLNVATTQNIPSPRQSHSSDIFYVDGVALLPPLAHYDKGRIGTPPIVGELKEAGMANITNPLWQKAVEDAAKRNGGFGDAEHGFLAYREDGFFRFKNDTIPPELAKRFAMASLITGIPITQLQITDKYPPSEIKGKEEWITKFEVELQKFLQDPSKGFKVSAKGVYFLGAYDPESQRVVFYKQKKRRGFAKFLGKVAKFIKPISTVLNFIPGVNVVAKAVLTGVQMLNSFVQAKYQKYSIKKLLQAFGVKR